MEFDDVFTELDFDMLFGDDCNILSNDDFGLGGSTHNDNNNCVCAEVGNMDERTPMSITPPLTEKDQTYIRQVGEIVSMYKDLMGFVNNCSKGLIETRFCYVRSKNYVKYLLLREIRNIIDDSHFIKQRYIDRYYEIKNIYFVYDRDEE
jgi:hypothetical protein